MALATATFTTLKRTKSKPDALNFWLIHQHMCALTRMPGEGCRWQGGKEETSQKTFPVAFTYFHRTSLQNTGSAASPVSSPPSPRSHGSCTKQELRSCRSSGFARRCKNVLHLETTPAVAESPEGWALLQTLTSKALPYPPDLSRASFTAPRPRRRLALPCHRSARPWVGASRRQMAGRTGSPGRQPRSPRGARRGARGFSTADSGGWRRRPGLPQAARGGGAEGRGARLPARLVYLWAKVTARWPRLLASSCCSWRAPRGPRQPAAGGGTRWSLITHTHTHTRTAGGGAAAGAAAAAAEAAALRCSAGAAAAQLPPRNGAAVTWGTGTSKVLLLLPLLPLRHTAALLLLGALGSLTENSGQETAAASRSGGSPCKWN